MTALVTTSLWLCFAVVFARKLLFAKATLLPSAAAVKEEAAIVEDDVV